MARSTRGRGSGPPRRRVPAKSQKRSFLIFTEGEKTEPGYLRHRYQASRSLVTIEFGGRDQPVRIVDAAIAALKDERRAARRAEGRPYDEVWCVFDDDDRPGIGELRERAEHAGVRVAVSNPCIELWFVLHWADQAAHIDGKAAQRLASDHLRCGKVLSAAALETLDTGYSDAVERGKALDAMHQRNLSAPGTNPSTSVFRLTESMRQGR